MTSPFTPPELVEGVPFVLQSVPMYPSSQKHFAFVRLVPTAQTMASAESEFAPLLIETMPALLRASVEGLNLDGILTVCNLARLVNLGSLAWRHFGVFANKVQVDLPIGALHSRRATALLKVACMMAF